MLVIRLFHFEDEQSNTFVSTVRDTTAKKGEEYNGLCNFLHSPVISSLLVPNIFLITLFSYILNPPLDTLKMLRVLANGSWRLKRPHMPSEGLILFFSQIKEEKKVPLVRKVVALLFGLYKSSSERDGGHRIKNAWVRYTIKLQLGVDRGSRLAFVQLRLPDWIRSDMELPLGNSSSDDDNEYHDNDDDDYDDDDETRVMGTKERIRRTVGRPWKR
ncbi:hypothetical protein ANN_06742 [Periplaneta americana]|uniref:Uncharacterized protein n=1 Tax=Periplaneta americana TaxID=6978 RepID=A0ABQ8TEA6_PERAM|nr:hypothetical protein ANN_06742 [Periplaneta americana]